MTREMKMHSYANRINGFWLALMLSVASLAVVADSEIDPNWKKHRVSVSFIDIEKRLFVASDREFFVPFNTPIYDSQDRPIALVNLKLGDSIWLYVERSNSKAIKRIIVR